MLWERLQTRVVPLSTLCKSPTLKSMTALLSNEGIDVLTRQNCARFFLLLLFLTHEYFYLALTFGTVILKKKKNYFFLFYFALLFANIYITLFFNFVYVVFFLLFLFCVTDAALSLVARVPNARAIYSAYIGCGRCTRWRASNKILCCVFTRIRIHIRQKCAQFLRNDY